MRIETKRTLVFVIALLVLVTSCLGRKSKEIGERAVAENTNKGVPEFLIPKGAVKDGILNGKAIKLPKPTYPPIAKATKAQGTVVVQVLVDENGDVIEARAVSGDPLLQAAAVVVARQAKFPPRIVSGKPVKVSGVLTYAFTPE